MNAISRSSCVFHNGIRNTSLTFRSVTVMYKTAHLGLWLLFKRLRLPGQTPVLASIAPSLLRLHYDMANLKDLLL